MIYEIKKLLKNPIYIIILFINIIIMMITAYFDSTHRPEKYFLKLSNYWNKLGFVLYFIIIVLSVYELVNDKTIGISDIVTATKVGRGKIYINKIIALIIFNLIFTTSLFLSNQVITLIFFKFCDSVSFGLGLKYTILASFGGILFSVFFYNIVSYNRNYVITFIIVFILISNNLFLRGHLIGKFSILNLLENGFFAEIMRGLSIHTWNNSFWYIYHLILVAVSIYLNLNRNMEGYN